MCRFSIVVSKNKDSIPDNKIKKLLWYANNSIFKQCYMEPYVPDDENNP